MTETPDTKYNFRVYLTVAITGSSYVEVEADAFTYQDGMATFFNRCCGKRAFVASFKKDHIIAIIKK